jgi:penicillin-binding protein 1A
MTMQKVAEASVAESLKALDERREAIARRRASSGRPQAAAAPASGDSALLQAALVAMDPETGHVRAMIGGRNFGDSSFNRAVQAQRQPGSAFKPFVYAAALEAGFTPATMIDRLNEPIATLEGDWTPEDEHSTADAMSLRQALRTSSNRAAVRLLQQVGIPETVQYAKTMGVGDVPSVPSLALGSGEVTLQAMTAAYAAFANKGRVPRPMVIRRVEDRDGRVLFAGEEQSTQAVTETTAYLMAGMLADVINAGTGARARALGFALPAAGKTGTTNEYRDAWFVGFTPMLVAGVWVGFDEPRTILPNGFASDIAVPLWASFMKGATRGNKPGGLASASVCRLSGLLASEGCEHVDVIEDGGARSTRSMVYTEYFAKGTAPDRRCDLHPTRGFFGAIAAVFGGSERPAPPRLEDTGAPVAAAVVVAEPPPAVAEAVAPQPEPPKRRGFWGRLFGRGNDENDTPKQKKPEPPRPTTRTTR